MKPSRPDAVLRNGRGMSMLQPGGRYTATNATLRELIQSAYARTGFDRPEVVGGPAWIDSDRFDIVAKAETNHVLDADGLPTRTFMMVRTLLVDRFKLRIHEEARERPIYALVMSRRDGAFGPRLQRSNIDCASVLDDLRNGRTPSREPGAPPPCSVGPAPGRLTGTAITIPQLANLLSARVGRPVVDRTGLKGNFDWQIEFAPESEQLSADGNPSQADRGPSIFTALQEQLGLKLESTRGRVDVLVVDEAHRPTPD